jgi:hypothetical protein
MTPTVTEVVSAVVGSVVEVVVLDVVEVDVDDRVVVDTESSPPHAAPSNPRASTAPPSATKRRVMTAAIEAR